ncbi:MAG TPA: signal peptidase I [Nocardioidaceae bacterium]|nr:signal peptidase I [Nocardioidaceae bacterium]
MGGHRKARKKLSWWQETILLLGLALVTSIVVKAFLMQMFFVPSASMRPQLIEKDRILIEKLSMWDGEVERGDVVVFEDPGGWLGTTPEPTGAQDLLSLIGLYPEGGHLVKRVVAVGGDRVVCCDRQGRLRVNGVPLDESDYLRHDMPPSQKQFDVDVPEDAVWVMGDNRSNSQDSRFHLEDPGGGTVPLENVVGKVWAIVWPTSRLEVLDRPETYEAVPAP